MGQPSTSFARSPAGSRRERLNTEAPARTPGSTPQSASRALAAWGLGGFVVLGLPDGMWGTAWPSMRHTFHQPLSSLGLILLCGMAGNLCTSLSTGILLRRFGVGRLLVCAALIAAVGASVLALATMWWLVLVAALLIGVAAGLLDTGLNTVVALSGRLRLLNMLHGAYGVGSALGPLLVTAALLWTSFRPAYVLLIALELLLAFGWWRTSSHWVPPTDTSPDADESSDAQAAVDSADERRPRHVRLLVALGVMVFFFYTGVEVTAGQWAASFFRGALGLSAGAAGPAVFVYWGSLTIARFAIAIPRRTPNPGTLVRIGCVGSLVASALIWWAPSTPVVIVAFGLMGATFAPVFPALVSLTPIRIGRARAHHAIGWQIAAANVGAAGLSALVGLILQHVGLTALGPCLLAISVVMVLCNAVLEVLSRPTSRIGRYPDGACGPHRSGRRLRRAVRPADRPPGARGQTSTARSCRTRSPVAEILARRPAAVILSGGPSSVYADGAPSVDPSLFDAGVPVFGICYGFQAMAQALGRRGRTHRGREYGRTALTVDTGVHGVLLEDLPAEQSVWMTHGDSVSAAPEGFVVTAVSAGAPVAAFEDVARGFAGVQFHPEVLHTEHGQRVLRRLPLPTAPASRRPGRWSTSSRSRSRRSAPRSATAGSSAACPAASTPRSPRRSCSAPSATSSPASSSTTGCCARARPSRSRRTSSPPPASGCTSSTRTSGSSMRWPGSPTPRRSARPSAASSSAPSRRPRARSSGGRRGARRLPGAGHALPGRRRVRWRHRAPPTSSRTTTSAACPTTCSSRWSSRCARCSRTRCAGSVSSSACPRRSSGASRSPARASASASSARSRASG